MEPIPQENGQIAAISTREKVRVCMVFHVFTAKATGITVEAFVDDSLTFVVFMAIGLFGVLSSSFVMFLPGSASTLPPQSADDRRKSRLKTRFMRTRRV